MTASAAWEPTWPWVDASVPLRVELTPTLTIFRGPSQVWPLCCVTNTANFASLWFFTTVVEVTDAWRCPGIKWSYWRLTVSWNHRHSWRLCLSANTEVNLNPGRSVKGAFCLSKRLFNGIDRDVGVAGTDKDVFSVLGLLNNPPGIYDFLRFKKNIKLYKNWVNYQTWAITESFLKMMAEIKRETSDASDSD